MSVRRVDSTRMDNALFDAYRNTQYVVEPFGRGGGLRFELRVGERNPAFELLVADEETSPTTWAMLTAYNPGSQKRSNRENQAAHRRLKRLLEKCSARVWVGHGSSEDGTWSEPMWVAAGIALENALELGRQFGQNAVLFGEVGGPARLLVSDDGRDETHGAPRERPLAGSAATHAQTSQEVIERIRALAALLECVAGVGVTLRVGPPATEEDIEALEPGEEFDPADERLWFPSAVLDMARVANGVELRWRSEQGSEIGPAGGVIRIASLSELQRDKTSAISETSVSWTWLPDSSSAYVVINDDEPDLVHLYEHGTYYILNEGNDPLEVLNLAIDRLGLPSWELSFAWPERLTDEDDALKELAESERVAATVWRMLGAVPSSLPAQFNRRSMQ